jgi:peroxiredoxin
MSKVKIGNPAPDFTLQSAEGETVSLGNLVKSGNNVLLVFLRHLG